MRFYLFTTIVVLFLTGCVATSSLSSEKITSEEASLVRAVHNKINSYRTSKRLKLLTLDPFLSQIALEHSRDMAAGSVRFGHSGFDKRVRSIQQNVTMQSIAENVGSNRGFADPAASVVKEWLGSRSHSTNIKGDFLKTGIGVKRNKKGQYFFTQIFLK